jgi:hypothetical protein
MFRTGCWLIVIALIAPSFGLKYNTADYGFCRELYGLSSRAAGVADFGGFGLLDRGFVDRQITSFRVEGGLDTNGQRGVVADVAERQTGHHWYF